MKSLRDKLVTEVKHTLASSWKDSIDTSVKTAERKKVHQYIYNALDYKGTTGKIYRDESWEGVREVSKVVNAALDDLNKKTY